MNLREIKGLGEVRIKKLQAAGIETPLDLCCRFPAKYIELGKVNRFELFRAGDEVVACGRMVSAVNKVIRKNLRFIKVEFDTQSGGKFWATWFNQPYISRAIKPGKVYYIIGKLQIKAGKVELSAPVLKDFDGDVENMIPVYKSVGLPAAVYRDAVKTALSQIRIKSCLTDEIRVKFGLVETDAAIKAVHFPQNLEDAKRAGESLSLENLAAHIALFMQAKQKNAKNKPHSYHIKNDKSSEMGKMIGDADVIFSNANKTEYDERGYSVKIIERLPSELSFKLTDDQNAVLNHIIEVLNSPKPANILIEGDVGCGKTIVCMLAMRYAADCGLQSVLMAPTEILARQHFSAAAKLFDSSELEYLSGSQSAAQRSSARFNILHGNAKAIIGTHSVFTDSVEYQNLALVITDEQQRFGVVQRGALENKAALPDSIVMSATPIPRTLALTLYGDLDLVRIMQKPKQRARIFTRFVGEKIKEMYDYIQKKAAVGEQTYIVCSRIEDDEEQKLVGAVDLYRRLKTKFWDKLGLLHGKLSEADKARVMDDFVAGKIRILVATVIIEVGIDVPSATTMVIFNAERYGLCQLHQLRGRIGRGSMDSYCFLLTDTENATDRLKHLVECDDGFTLAERDFELRGAGDFLGVRQHGISLTFTGEPITAQLLARAREIAAHIPTITESAVLNTEANMLYFKVLALN